jgi:hypothetical protein
MADAKPKKTDPTTNHEGLVANQETSIRDAKHPDEKPDPTTVAQIEVIEGS